MATWIWQCYVCPVGEKFVHIGAPLYVSSNCKRLQSTHLQGQTHDPQESPHLFQSPPNCTRITSRIQSRILLFEPTYYYWKSPRYWGGTSMTVSQLWFFATLLIWCTRCSPLNKWLNMQVGPVKEGRFRTRKKTKTKHSASMPSIPSGGTMDALPNGLSSK